MRSPFTASDLFVESRPASSVVFVIDGDASLQWTLDAMARGACWRTETVPSISALLSQQRSFGPSCLVLDVSLLDSDDLLLRPWPTEVPVICVAGVGDLALCVRAMKAGAVDVLTKPVASGPMLEAVLLALNRSDAALRREAELKQMRQRHASLTRREREVMALVVSGLLNKQVACDLGISEITVKAHRGRVMRKMKTQSLANLVMIAARLQLAQCDGLAPSARHRPLSQRRPEESWTRRSELRP